MYYLKDSVWGGGGGRGGGDGEIDKGTKDRARERKRQKDGAGKTERRERDRSWVEDRRGYERQKLAEKDTQRDKQKKTETQRE